MKCYKLIILINLYFNTTIGFFLPQIFREWHPIAIDVKINKQVPHIINYGKLPLVLWYNNDIPQTAIGYCKHLGAKHVNSYIHNNCLICPNHLTVHNESDTIGTTVIKDGVVWWSYKSIKKTPPSLFKNPDNVNHFYIDVNSSLQNIVLEFMHSNSITYAKNNRNKFFIKKQLFNKEHRIVYKYPFYLKGSIDRKINFGINFLPLQEDKTRLFINIDVINIKYFLYYFLYFKLCNLRYYDNNIVFKYLLVLNDVKDDNYLKKIYLLFDKYMFPNDSIVYSFYKYRKFY
jgi:hypothetical protein